MDPKECWLYLGIEPTQDMKVIKRAFAKLIKTVDPEAEPERYQKLREAYDLARSLVELPKAEFLALGSPEDLPWEEQLLPFELSEDDSDFDSPSKGDETKACWEHLGIEPTQDMKVIKRAFAKLIKTVDPEAEPERYQKLREAYDLARSLVELPEEEFRALGSREELPWEEQPLPPEILDFESKLKRDNTVSAPFKTALFKAVASNQDPVDKARADAAEPVVEILNALLRDDETTANTLLIILRTSESYRRDGVYRQEVEYMLMVGVLEAPWEKLPLGFCLRVTEPWMNDQVDVNSVFWNVKTDHPYWFVYFEFCHKVKAEQYRLRLQEQLDHPDGSDFCKAVRLLIESTPEAMPQFTIPRMKMEISRMIERISADVSGTFESWMLDNEKWAAWVEWERGRRAKRGMGKLIIYPVMLAMLFLLMGDYAGMDLEAGVVYAVLAFFTPYCATRLVGKSSPAWGFGFSTLSCAVLFSVWCVFGVRLARPYGFLFYNFIGLLLPLVLLGLAVFSVRFFPGDEDKPASYHHPDDPVLRAPRLY